MGEKLQQLVLSALSRAATQPGMQPLHSQRGVVGLFPAGQGGKQAAQHSCQQGYLNEAGTLQPMGLAYLLRERPPRQLLEDFVRAIEAREQQLHELGQQVCTLLTSHEAMREHLMRVLASFEMPLDSYCENQLLTAVAQWAGSEDMPLPELYRQAGQGLSIGRFHDSLRSLAAQGRIRIQPWTGPLYALPQPELALMIGHEIGYYVSLVGKE
ncbi:MAG: hypothetical protein SNJ82_13315 [Gemmataceae bacterium]